MDANTTDTLDLYELLSAVNRAEIWQDGDRSNYYLSQVFGLSDPWKDVTAEVASAHQDCLVELVERSSDARLWRLTSKGVARLSRMRNPRLLDRVAAAIRR
jgi:hypothetical protein